MAVAQAIPAVRRRMTEDEFLRLPDDGRKWELVDRERKEVLAGWSLRQIEQGAYFPHPHCSPGDAVR